MYLRAGKMLLLLGIDPVEGVGHNIEEVEAKEMILSEASGATISGLPHVTGMGLNFGGLYGDVSASFFL